MTTEIILRSFPYNGHSIPVSFNEKAFFNATAAAKTFDKRPNDWLKTQDTQEYIVAITKIFVIQQDQLVIVQQGAPEAGGGTWLHPKLAVAFARWLNPEFGVWCDLQVEEILRTRNAPVAEFPGRPSMTLQDFGAYKETLSPQTTFKELYAENLEFEYLIRKTMVRLIDTQGKYIALLEDSLKQSKVATSRT